MNKAPAIIKVPKEPFKKNILFLRPFVLGQLGPMGLGVFPAPGSQAKASTAGL